MGIQLSPVEVSPPSSVPLLRAVVHAGPVDRPRKAQVGLARQMSCVLLGRRQGPTDGSLEHSSRRSFRRRSKLVRAPNPGSRGICPREAPD